MISSVLTLSLSLYLALSLSLSLSLSSDLAGVGDDGDDEKEKTAYKYWFMHLVMVLAGMYMAALLTNWATFSGGAFTDGSFCVDEGIGAMWSKAATSWLISLLYVWTLFAPVLMPGRFNND